MKKNFHIPIYTVIALVFLWCICNTVRAHFLASSVASVNDSQAKQWETLVELKKEVISVHDEMAATTSGPAFNADAWKSKYMDSDQYAKDCYAWQTTHPEVVKKHICTQTEDCSSGRPVCDQHEDGSCDFDMRKQAPNGSIQSVYCEEQANPADFIK